MDIVEIRTVAALLALSLASSAAHGLDLRPESGVWFETSDATSSGLMITQQSNSVAVGVYSYDAAGNATWSLAVGPVRQGIFEAPLITYAGGTCITCDTGEGPASEVRNQALRIEFLSTTRGVLTIDGDSAPIQSLSWIGYRPAGLQNDASPYASLVPEFFGTWVFAGADEESTFYQRNTFLGLAFIDPPGFESGDFIYIDSNSPVQGSTEWIKCIGHRLTTMPAYCVLERRTSGSSTQTPVLTALVADIGAERIVAYEGGPLFDAQGNAIRGENLIYGFRIPNVPIDRTENQGQ